jgi:hypothetical protein
MLETITSNNKLNFEQFRKWLDINPSVRLIISECVRPNLWSLDGVNNSYLLKAPSLNGFVKNGIEQPIRKLSINAAESK